MAYYKVNIAKLGNGEFSLDRVPFIYIPSKNDRVHVVIEGDRLDTLAFKYYKNSTLWYIIADTNGIYNPFELEIGSELLIPGNI